MKSLVSKIIAVNLLACLVLVLIYPHLMIAPGKLMQGHQKLTEDCFACHTPFLRSSPKKCIVCHELEKIGKFKTTDEKIVKKAGTVAFHQKLVEQDCVACHSDHQGVKVYRKIHHFSHELVMESVRKECKGCHENPDDKFHREQELNCSTCHNQDDWQPASIDHEKYFISVSDRKCTGCHKKPNDKFHRKQDLDCGLCHGLNKWKPASFDHDQYFRSTGKKTCTECHKKPDDKLHSQLKGQCDTCHSLKKWKPATFEHDEYFRFDKDHKTECVTCHENDDYSQYTCYGCHEHSRGKIREEHEEEGIRDYEKCTECHRSGDEDEAKRIWRSKPGQSGKYREKDHDDDD